VPSSTRSVERVAVATLQEDLDALPVAAHDRLDLDVLAALRHWPAKIICLKSMLKVWKTRRPTRRTNGAKRSALVLSSVKLP